MAGLYTDNPYKVLGVSEDASEQEIKKAYRKLALIHHPDRQTNDKDREAASSKFSKIAHAYEILTDDDLRKEYDRLQRLVEDGSPNPSPGGGQRKGSRNPPPAFRPVFNDPYEVWKRDFREQFGIEYPGAQYDWVDAEKGEPISPAQSMVPSAPAKKGLFNRGGGESKPKADSSPRKSFFPFRRNNANSTDLVVRDPAQASPGTKNQQQIVEHDPNSRAIVAAASPGRNNRPIKVETTTRKEGPVTITTTTLTRPDGSTESIVQKTGIPGPKPGSDKPMLLEGPKQHKMIEGPKQHKMIEGLKQHKMIEGPKAKKSAPKSPAGRSSGTKPVGLITQGPGGNVPRIKG
jgi:curved DNA-binding protein CbpA